MINCAPTVSKEDVCPECAPTVPQLCPKLNCLHFVLRLCPNCAPTVPQLCLNCAPTGFASTVPQLCPNCAPSNFMPQLCPSCAPTVPQLCPRVFDFVPQLCPNCASTVPQLCLTRLPNCRQLKFGDTSRGTWEPHCYSPLLVWEIICVVVVPHSLASKQVGKSPS